MRAPWNTRAVAGSSADMAIDLVSDDDDEVQILGVRVPVASASTRVESVEQPPVRVYHTRAVTRAQAAAETAGPQTRSTPHAETSVNPGSRAHARAEASDTASGNTLWAAPVRPPTQDRVSSNVEEAASTTSPWEPSPDEPASALKPAANGQSGQTNTELTRYHSTDQTQADEPEVSALSHFSRASLHSRRSVNNKAVVPAPVARNEILVQRPMLGTHQDVSTLAAEIPGLPRWNALHRDLPYRNGGSGSGAIASLVASQESLPTQEGVSRAEDRAIKSAADTQGPEQLTDFPHASTSRAGGTALSPLLSLASLGRRDRVARYEEISLSIASIQKQARNERYEIRSRRPRPSSADYERHRPNKSNKKKEKKERKEKRKKEKKEKKGKVKNEKKGKELDQDLLMLTTGHKKLTFWKQQAAKELKIGPEMKLISASVALFDRKSIQTVLPNRYLRMSTSSKKNHLRTIAFPGSVEMLLDSPMTAVRNAYNEHTSDKLDTARLVLWTDGSAGGGMYGQSRGFAVTWRRSTATGWGRWEAAGYQAQGGSLGSNDIETLGVMKALAQACVLVNEMSGQVKAVAIYTDSTGALRVAQDSNHPLGRHIIRKARTLTRLGPTLSLHWCPGHSGVPGNELADKIADISRSHIYGRNAEFVDLSDDDGEDDWEDI